MVRSRLIVFVFLLGIALAACGGDENNQEPPVVQESAADPEPTVEEAFASSVLLARDSTWSATYEASISGPFGTLDSLELIAYSDGPARYRSDRLTGIESRTYMIDGTTTVCEGSGTWVCFGDEALLQDAIHFMDESISLEEYAVEPSPTRTIAGVDADCFAIRFDETGSGEYCFSTDGIPLFVRASIDDMVSEREAIAFDTQVAEETWIIPRSE